LLEVVLDFLLELVLVLQDVLEPVVFLHWVCPLQLLQKVVLLYYDIFYLLTLEVFVDFTLVQVSPELLSMVSEFVLAFFNLTNQRKERVIVFFLI
jgi:hypothetical protein